MRAEYPDWVHEMIFTFLLIFFSSVAAVLNQQNPLTELLKSNPNVTEFATLLMSYSDLYSNLSYQHGITILAPNNSAFAKLPYSTLGPGFEANDTDVIRSVLKYHILPGIHSSDSFNGSFSFIPTELQDWNYTNLAKGQVVGGVQQSRGVNIFTSGLGERSTMLEAVSPFIYCFLPTI